LRPKIMESKIRGKVRQDRNEDRLRPLRLKKLFARGDEQGRRKERWGVLTSDRKGTPSLSNPNR